MYAHFRSSERNKALKLLSNAYVKQECKSTINKSKVIFLCLQLSSLATIQIAFSSLSADIPLVFFSLKYYFYSWDNDSILYCKLFTINLHLNGRKLS